MTAGLRAYVDPRRHDDVHVARQRRPASCCTTPSNGFSYTGTTTSSSPVGDVYGFEVTGSNGDLNSFLQGTLKVGLDIVENGSFEDPAIAPDAIAERQPLFSAPSTALTGWSV